MSEVLPLVSVIVPCRNEEEHIGDCQHSILRQEPVPGGIEIIVTDGMSTDNTRPILDRLSLEDSRILVVDNPGRIVSAGLNAGISAARGKIIIRMDAHTKYAPATWRCVRRRQVCSVCCGRSRPGGDLILRIDPVVSGG